MTKYSSDSNGENYQIEILKRLWNGISAGVNVAFEGEITAITPPTISVQPKALTAKGNKKQAIVEHVMVLVPATGGKVKLKVGDRVACGVFDHDISHYSSKGFYRQLIKTPHQVSNAFFIGRVADRGDFDGE
ncbi:hypothetical protein [Levilactobacillus andaensis]|uniref:hypothetical protein n=1 Tax=Levilactobacillus andaensis TaxID=2799570 RepID=UPI001941959F|nr:hypothetical protein [Levilactobacillus andaensis]